MRRSKLSRIPFRFYLALLRNNRKTTLLVGLCLCESVGEKNGRDVTCGRIVSCVGLSARDVMLDFSIRPTGPGFIVLHVFLAGDGDGEISMKQGWGNIHYIAQVGFDLIFDLI